MDCATKCMINWYSSYCTKVSALVLRGVSVPRLRVETMATVNTLNIENNNCVRVLLFLMLVSFSHWILFFCGWIPYLQRITQDWMNKSTSFLFMNIIIYNVYNKKNKQ